MPVITPADIDTTEIAKYVKAYSSNVRMSLQQGSSRLRMTVDTETVNGEELYINQTGTMAMRRRPNLTAKYEYTEMNHSRRRLIYDNFESAKLFAPMSKVAMQADMTGRIARAEAMAAGRKIDEIIINAFDGTASAGKNGTLSVPFPASQIINRPGGGGIPTAGMSIETLRELRYRFESVEVDPEATIYLVIDAKAKQQFLEDDKLTNADYTTVQALVRGQINSFMGFTFITSQRIKRFDASENQIALDEESNLLGTPVFGRALAYTQEAITLGVGSDVSTRVEWVVENGCWQIVTEMAMGATRMEEKRCIAVDFAYNPA